MTRRERVLQAIRHNEPDKVPKGELHIEAKLASALLGKACSMDYMNYERDKEVRELLNMDLVNVGDWPSEDIGVDSNGNRIYRSVYGEEYIFSGKSKHVIKPAISDIYEADAYSVPDISKVSGKIVSDFARNTDFFVFSQIGGPVSMINEMLGMEDYLVYAMLNTKEICVLAEKIMEYEIGKAKLFIDSGADGILMADDIAYNSGGFLPPEIMDQVAYPFYKAAIKAIKKHKEVPVFLHTDGDIRKMLDKIALCGFDGLHSLQPSAGMDIGQVKKDFGDALCLMGNMDLDYLMTFASPSEVENEVKRTIDIAAPGGGYILSTCNILVDAIPAVNALAMYNTAEAHGVNK